MKLLHLYHDIMSLYGEYANVLLLRDALRQFGDCEIEKKTVGDDFRFDAYDFVYIGSGTERGQKCVLADFRKRRDEFAAYVNSGKTALLTGNAFEMLGNFITDCDGNRFEGLGMMDFTVTEQNKTRDTADAIFTADFLSRPAVGFINKCSEIHGVSKPLFNVKMGLGNQKDDTGEGVRLRNLFGTHLTGPALVKNPELLVMMAKLISGKIPAPNPYSVKSYEVTLRELEKRLDEA